jgi:hypothetical protein
MRRLSSSSALRRACTAPPRRTALRLARQPNSVGNSELAPTATASQSKVARNNLAASDFCHSLSLPAVLHGLRRHFCHHEV